MAEFGIVASAIQLADIGARTALSISRLVSQLRHAHETVQKAGQQLENIRQLASFIEQTHATRPALHTSIPSALEKCMQDCFDPIRELDRMLVPLIYTITDRKQDRAHKAILTVKTKSQIEVVVNRIEVAKGNLLLCICNET